MTPFSDNPSEADVATLEAPAGDQVAPRQELAAGAASEPVVPPPVLGWCPVPWRHPLRAVAWIVRLLFGLASLLFLLSVLAAVPGLNFIALGYLLEVEGRLGRTGKLREAFPLLADAPRIGSIALGTYLWLLPLRLFGSMAADAHLIDPGSPADRFWHILLNLAWVAISVHLCLALARGGALICFFRPFKNYFWLRHTLRAGNYWQLASYQVRAFVQRLRIPHHFWLGLRGFGVAFAWLVIPTAFYAAVQRPEGARVLLTLMGGVLLTLALSWAPFLQARFTVEDRFRAGLQLREVRVLNKFAPCSWMLATILLYALSLPLYLFKIALLPADAMWLVTPVFVLSIYPTRIMTGWAYGRAVRRRAAGKKMAHWSLRWLCCLLTMALLGAYVFILYFTQFIGEEGKRVLFQHHALLLPSPF